MLASIALASGPEPLHAQPTAGQHDARPLFPRPRLAPAADTSDWEAYFDRGVELLPVRADMAQAAFYWAARLNPERAEPLFARWVAFHLRDQRRWADYLAGRQKTLENPAVIAADSLRLRAMGRNPFVHRGLELILYDRMPGRWGADDVTRGWLAYAKPDLRNAVRYFGQAIARNPQKRLWLRATRAQAFVGLGQLDSAFAELVALQTELTRRDAERIVVAYESKEMLEYAIGRLQVARRQPGLAREAFSRSLVENLGFAPAHFWLGELALTANDMAGAVEAYEAALVLDPSDAVLQFRYGMALARLGRWPQAIAAQQRATALEPFYAAPWLELGRALEGTGDAAGARAAYEAYLARAPRSDAEGRGFVQKRLAALGSTTGGP